MKEYGIINLLLTSNSPAKMNLKNKFTLLFLSCQCIVAIAQIKPPQPYGPIPNENQLRWQEMEYYGFIHLSVNTYTDMAWGFGNEDPATFNPTELDCRQWARIAKEAGMTGIILTAKHHSGFCLWPSKFTEYSVKNSPWRNGKGDLVKEMADACREYGLKFGVYLSPWDRNHADYGRPAYIAYFRSQLKELLTNYGEVFEVWFDGANGGSGYYGGANETRNIDRTNYYDWKNTYKLVRELQPKIVIWNDGGERADLRWVGTEAGYVGETNWSLLDSTGEVTNDMLQHGLANGNAWVPGEVNTSIRPEWFYHKKEDIKVKKLPELMDIYYNSIGRNGTLLLNFPIMPNGLIHKTDSTNVIEFAKAIRDAFATDLAKSASPQASNIRGNDKTFAADKSIDNSNDTYWTTDDAITTGTLTLNFKKPVTFNRFLIQEYIRLGQRVKSFSVEAFVNGKWSDITRGTTIGYKRILRFKSVTASRVRISIEGSKSCPLISTVSIYNAPQILAPPSITRNQAGDILITPADFESEIYYSLDGSDPTIKSAKYNGAFKTQDGKVQVKCTAFDPKTQRFSAISEENFDVSRTLWKIVGVEDKNAYNILDGNTDTQWYQNKYNSFPVDVVIDLGKIENVAGFRYLPDQHWWGSGIVSKYSFFVSEDNVSWTMVHEGEFSNIKNNPSWQTQTFSPIKGRYIKFRALKNTQGDNAVGYSEIDIITEDI